MAFSIGDFFPLRGSRMAARVARQAKRPSVGSEGRPVRVPARSSAFRFEPIEARVLLSADVFNVTQAAYVGSPLLGVEVYNDLMEGLALVDNVANGIDGSTAWGDALGTHIPGLLVRTTGNPQLFFPPTVGLVLDNADENFNALTTKVAQLLDDAGQSGLASGFATNLDALSANFGSVSINVNMLDVDPGTDGVQTFLLKSTGVPNSYEFLYKLEVVITATDADGKDTYSLDLGRNADALEIDYLAAANTDAYLPKIALSSKYRFEAVLGAGATIVESLYDPDNNPETDNSYTITTVTPTGGFLRDPEFSAGVADVVNTTTPIEVLQFGFLDVRAKAGTADFDLRVGARYQGNFTTAGQISGATPTVDTAGSFIEVLLPVEVAPATTLLGDGFAGISPVIRLFSTNPFDPIHDPVAASKDFRTAIQIELQDFEKLNPFRNLDAAGLANVFSGLSNLLDQLQSKAQLFGLKLPLIDAAKVSDMLQFDGPMKVLYEKLTKEVNGTRQADFTNVQQFVGKLQTALNQILADFNTATSQGLALSTTINPRYSFIAGTPTLLFTIELHAAPTGDPLDVAGNLGLSLAPLGDVKVTGSMIQASSFSVQLTLGIELVEAPNVGVIAAAAPSALVGAPVSGDVSGESKFNLVLGNVGSVQVTLAGANHGSAAALAAALDTAIGAAITAALANGSLKPAAELDDPPPAVEVVANAQGRIVISSTTLPYLQIVNRGGVTAFAGLGFLDLQRGTASRLPVNGQLSGDASFTLTLGGVTKTVTLTKVATDNNNGIAALVADLNALLSDPANFGNSASGKPYVSTEGNDVIGLRLKISDGEKFVRIDGSNAVAKAELGLLDDALSAPLMIRGTAGITYDATEQADALPSNGNAGAVAFTIELVQNGVGSGAINVSANLIENNFDPVTLQGLTAGQAAVKAAQDITDALDKALLPNGQALSTVLIATAVEFRNANNQGTDKWGIRFSQPAASLDTTLSFAFADSITIAGISNTEDIGLKNGTADRVGPSLVNTLGGITEFTINLTGAGGVVKQQKISLDPTTITSNTLSGVVDAINAFIAASSVPEIKNNVVAGLDGARLVFAVTSPAFRVIELSNVNARAIDNLGLEEGISARTFEGVQAFVQDVHLDASVNLVGTATGSANFGFVSLNLAGAVATLQAGVDVDLATGKAIYVRDFFNALSRPIDAADGLVALLNETGNPAKLLDFTPGANEEIDITGSASLAWLGGITVAGAGGVATDLAGELAGAVVPSISITLPDITQLNTLQVSADLGGLADLANFGFDDALAALRAIAQWLEAYVQKLDIVNEELPLLGISLSETLGFVKDFSKAVEDIAANPSKSLQALLDKVNEGLQRFIGPTATIRYQTNSPGILTFKLEFDRGVADILPIELDMESLLAGQGIAIPGLKLAGSANLAAQFGFDASLVFGVNVAGLSSLLDQTVYNPAAVLEQIFLVVEDNDANNIDGFTKLDLTAFAKAENVTFTGALGPLGLFVTNGGAVLNSNGVFGNNTPASIKIRLPDVGADNGYITLGDFFNPVNATQIFNTSNVQVNLGVAAVLPVSFPTSSNFIGNLDFKANVTNPFAANGITYALNSVPDFSGAFSNLGLLDTLNLFLAGADVVLGSLGDLITGEVFGADDLADLPLVGDALADAGKFIDQIRDEVIPAITNIIETAPELAADIFKSVGEVFQNALSSMGFLASSVKLNFINGAGSVFKTYDFGGAEDFSTLSASVMSADGFSFTIDLGVALQIKPNDVNLNLEVFKLEITEPITVNIAADLTFGLGVSLSEGFFFQVKPDGEADLSGSITINLPETIDAQLFFLQLTAENNNFGTVQSDLRAAFSVDVQGTGSTGRLGFGDIGNLGFDVDFGAQVDLDFILKLGVSERLTDGIGLPKILADFDFSWGFGDLVLGGAQYGIDANHTAKPLLELGNIRLDIGSFLGDTIGPFVTDIYEVIAPIDPLLDVLTDPIPVLSDLLGPTSLLDVAATFGLVNAGLVTALEVLDQVVDFAATVANAAEGSQGYVTIYEGKFSFGGSSGLDLTNMGQVGSLTDPGQALKSVLQGIAGEFGGSVPQELNDAIDFINSGLQAGELGKLTNKVGGGFSFPFLDNVDEVLGLFFGRNMTLVAYDLPPLEFGFDFSIYVPIWDGLGARFAGGINAVIDLAFGYDTEGLFRFINGGQNPLDLVQGFFVYDDNPFGGFGGIDVPEVEITGKITAAAELNLVVASAGVGGGIFATIGFDLADPDGDMRVRLDEIIANLVNGFEKGVGPLGLFDVDAIIEAKLFAYIEALFGIWRKEFQFGPSIPLYEAQYSVPHDPVLATDMENGTLRLNIGDFAADRIYTNNGADDPVDGAETIEVEILSTTEIRVKGSGPDFSEDWQSFKRPEGFDLILGFAGLDDDSVKIVKDMTAGAVRVELRGGAGKDTLQGGDGNDLLLGEAGDDHLIGGKGLDVIEGGAGNDLIEGGAGNDTLRGGAGNDVIIGGADNDLIFGDAGDDILAGNAGIDTILGGDGRDLISGGAGADVLLGEAGNDRIWGDLDFKFAGRTLLLLAGTDEPDFAIPAVVDQGNDYIAGGGGSDEIQGNGGNDWIWGDSSFKLSASFALQGSGLGTLLLLPTFGTFGNDNLSGGAGDDTIFGEGGNDVIRGDNVRIDNENDGDPFTWAEGDRFSAGTAHGGTDGNDTLYGGRDSDIIYGNGGDDIIAGGTENDILFGNAGNDTITGDTGADVIFGDNGHVEVFASGNTVLGGTYGAPTQDFKRLESDSDTGDGDDTIDAGQDNDIVFGGGGLGSQVGIGAIGQTIEDLIKAGSGDDIVFGDHGKVIFTYAIAAGRAFATEIESVDKDFGGDDQILGSTGRDILIGGKGGDFIDGDDLLNDDDPDSRDVLAGDHIRMEQAVTLVTVTPHAKVADVYVAAPMRIVSTEDDPAQGGDDTLDGRQDNDILIGGPGDDKGTGGLGNDVLLGDRGEVIFDIAFITPNAAGYEFNRDELFVLKTVRSIDLALANIPFTGIDRLSGGDGNDVVIGGGRGDFLYGDAELNGAVGALTADSDILIGDNGQVDYLQHGKLARVFTTDTLDATGGDDHIEGNSGVDIALGGVGGDDIWGDAQVAGATDGDDILLGDNGRVDFSLDLDLDLEPVVGVPNLATLDLIESSTDGRGAVDRIRGNAGSDVAMGGTAGDFIYGDDESASGDEADGNDMLLGDNGQVLLVNPARDPASDGSDRRLVRGGAVALLRSTDENDAADNTGGRDTIEGNAGGDIILGGVRGDYLYGDRVTATVSSNTNDLNDIILGDNGALEWLSTGRMGDLPEDVRNGDPRWNSQLPVAFPTNVRDSNLDTLDLITTEQPRNGGRDLIFGGNGRDVAFGGTDADTIHGDSGDDDPPLLSTNGNDLLFGDHGRLYLQLSVRPDIYSRNFFSIHTGQLDGGEGDRIWGEEGMDILLGGQGDDRLWGGSGDDDLTGGHNVEGGVDELTATTIRITTGAHEWNDVMDGGSENDTLAGDNAVIWRTGQVTSPRYQLLTAATLYTTTESTVTVNVAADPIAAAQQDPQGALGRYVFLLDHDKATPVDRYGRDVMAGGSERDTMFGQRGDDLMQGDGFVQLTLAPAAPAGEVTRTLTVADSALVPPLLTADLTDGVHLFRVPEQTSDGDDYMEGNGGSDHMYGGLGQDDMIGGSSSLYGLTTAFQRPDSSDWMWGGAGVQTARGDQGYFQSNPTGTDPAGLAAETFIASERGRDADTMLGDNGNIFRIVQELAGPNTNGQTAYLRFYYDVLTPGYSNGQLLVVRAMQWLDYTLGGPDFDQDLNQSGIQTTQGADNGAGDYIHGEAGNDTIHGMAGSDILFGDAHDDDITGGYGHDWISAGTGQDGVIGDDGLIRTSRNSALGEPVFGVAGLTGNDTRYSDGDVLGEVITTPGSIQRAIINVEGELTKAMDLTPLSVDARWGAVDDEFGYAGDSSAFGAPYADDLIYGGLGSDWLHGGSGDDGILGAEALPVYYEVANGATPSTGTTNASEVNYGDQLRFNPIDVISNHERERAGEFALYDEYNPRRQIRVSLSNGWDGELLAAHGFDFILNFNENEGLVRGSETVPTNGNNTIVTGPVRDDGDDKIFGGTGNDWLVGGTGRDNVYGGWGNDLMNVDDDQTFDTDGVVLNSEILNDTPDTHSTYEDRAYGGAGRDVLIGNTGGDRLIDWVGEWNSYLVPFAPFGMATVSRTLQPQLPEYLYALSRADGADPTIVADGNGTAERNGEPYGELGLVLQKDVAWQDQTGAPADPQAGNIPGGKRDVLRSADFNNQQGQGFVPESGSWKISSGKYEVAPATTGSNKDAISLYFTGEPLPLYFEVAATINAIKPTAGFKANAYIIFDYVSPTDFKFAGINVSTNKIEIGQRASWGFQVLASKNMLLKAGQDYNVLLAVNGNAVTFVVNGSNALTHAFAARVDDMGYAHPIRDAMVGLGGDNARARIDDVRLQILPPNFAWQASDAFDAAPVLLTSGAGSWAQSAGRLSGSPASSTGIALADNDIAVGANAVLQIDAKLSLSAPSSIAGVTFDKYSDVDFKWAGLSLATKQVLVGHYTAKGGWVVDQAIARADLTTNVDYTLGVTLKGSTVSVTLNGSAVLSRVYNAGVVDGAVGVFAKGGAASFDSFGLKTDDVAFAAGMVSGAMTTSTISSTSTSGPTEKLASAAAPVPAGMTSTDPTPTTLSIESTAPILLQSTLAGNRLVAQDALGFSSSLGGSSAPTVTAAMPESTLLSTSAASTDVDRDLARLRAAAVPAQPVEIDWTAGPAADVAATPQRGWQLEFLTALEAGQGLSRANRSMSLLV